MPFEETEILLDEDIGLFNNWLYYTELQKMFYEFDRAMEQGFYEQWAGMAPLSLKAERKLKQEACM